MRKFATSKTTRNQGQAQLEFLISMGLLVMLISAVTTLAIELWGVTQARFACQSSLRRLILDSRYPTKMSAPTFCNEVNRTLKTMALQSLKLRLCQWDEKGHTIRVDAQLEGRLFRKIPFQCQYKKVFS